MTFWWVFICTLYHKDYILSMSWLDARKFCLYEWNVGRREVGRPPGLSPQRSPTLASWHPNQEPDLWTGTGAPIQMDEVMFQHLSPHTEGLNWIYWAGELIMINADMEAFQFIFAWSEWESESEWVVEWGRGQEKSICQIVQIVESCYDEINQ